MELLVHWIHGDIKKYSTLGEIGFKCTVVRGSDFKDAMYNFFASDVAAEYQKKLAKDLNYWNWSNFDFIRRFGDISGYRFTAYKKGDSFIYTDTGPVDYDEK